jgi:transposase InsO family protein
MTFEVRGYPPHARQRKQNKRDPGLARAARCRMVLHYAGKPMQNGFVESFNGCLRNECLNEHLFANLYEARKRIDHNTNRPHTKAGLV